MRSKSVAALLAVALLSVACGSVATPVAVRRASLDPVPGATSTTSTGPTGAPASTGAPGSPPPLSLPTTVSPGTTGTSGTADPASSTVPATTTPAVDSLPGHPLSSIDWQPDPTNPAVQTGHLLVPIDYANPSAGTFDLFVGRHLATDTKRRIGLLLVNRGGPGFESADFATHAEDVYSPTLTSRFDIVAWDPRGTGLSTPAIDCITDYDHFFAAGDITPDTPEERQQLIDLAKELEDDCTTKNAAILQHVGTNDSARDMDSIRLALGEQQVSYFGFSYGSELGATWATLFPQTVRATVLDGATDPNVSLAQRGLEQTKGFEGSLDRFLADCSKKTDCAFHSGGDAASAFDALMLQLDDHPIPSEPGRPDVTRGVALSAVGQAMYSDAEWPTLATALADAQRGDGKGLLALYDEYFQRLPDGTYDNSLEAFQVISCMDAAERSTVEQEDAFAQQVRAVAPRFSPGTVGSYMCTFFPPSQDPRITITGKGAGPILVVGTTGDPATPLTDSQAMAKALEQGHLLTVDANEHTGYHVNKCSFSTVDSYLVNLKLPPVGTTC
jgi:pimeloyl-ACP methyl ester carboxylesterase